MADNTEESKDSFLTQILEYGGAVIIIGVILLFLILTSVKSCSKIDCKNIDTLRNSPISFSKIKLEKNDTSALLINRKMLNELKLTTDSINNKVKEINEISKKIDNIQKENSDDFKLYLAIISSVFAIVGFFGFKSIHDTRQTAIESVKIKAEEVAKKVTDEKMKEYVEKNVSTIMDSYLDNEGNEIIKEHSEKISKEIAFEESGKVAKNITEEEFNKLRAKYEEAKLAMKLDIESIERDRYSLLRRIQDLEQKIYRLPDPEDDENEDPREDNNETLV